MCARVYVCLCVGVYVCLHMCIRLYIFMCIPSSLVIILTVGLYFLAYTRGMYILYFSSQIYGPTDRRRFQTAKKIDIIGLV